MCMDDYSHGIVMRHRIAEAEERAAKHYLLREIGSPRSRQSLWERVLRLVRASSNRPTNRLKKVLFP